MVVPGNRFKYSETILVRRAQRNRIEKHGSPTVSVGTYGHRGASRAERSVAPPFARGAFEEAEYAYMATREAFQNAGIDDDFLQHNEMGIIFGNDSSAKPVIEAANIMAEKHDSALLGSGLIFQSMNSTVNMNLSSIFHLTGINFTVSSACASGSHSIGLGYLLIKQGLQDRVLAAPRRPTIIPW